MVWLQIQLEKHLYVIFKVPLKTDTKNEYESKSTRDEMASSADELERCFLDIGHWMSANRLNLNVDKTELLFASSGHCCAALKSSYPMLKLGADTAVASSHVRLLGETFRWT